MSQTQSKESKGNKTLVIFAAIAALIGVAVAVYFYVIKPKQTVNPTPTTEGDTQTPSSPSVKTVQITATNDADPIPRDWQIFKTNPTGKLIGSNGMYGVYDGMQPVQKAIFDSGATWTVELPSGTYYLIIGQSGGDSYGTYSGTVTTQQKSPVPFANVDAQHAAAFTI
jgi:hypothetical protein